MKRYALCGLFVFSCSFLQGFERSQTHVRVTKNIKYSKSLLKELGSSYLASLLASGFVGATTGSVVRYLEKRWDIESSPVSVFLILTGWLLESEFRNDLIAGLQKDLDANQTEHKKGLMFKTAWLASWLAYLQVQ